MPTSIDAEPLSVSTSSTRTLESVWKEVAPQLHRFVRAVGLDADCGDDVLQDVYSIALRKQPAGIDADGMRRWLFRVTANRCNLEHRRVHRWRSAKRGFAELWAARRERNDTDHQVCKNEERELVREALTALQPALRQVLVLRYYIAFDSKEIGRILDLPDSTVRSHLRRARLQLAEYLTQSGYEHD